MEVGAHVKPCEVVEVNQLNNVHTTYKKKGGPVEGGRRSSILLFDGSEVGPAREL